MMYQINTDNNQWIYQTRTNEIDRIEVGFEIDPEEGEETEITIFSICIVRENDPPNQRASGSIERQEVFRFVNQETIMRLAMEILRELKRKTWNEVFAKPLCF